MHPPSRSTLLAYAALAAVVVLLGVRWLRADQQQPATGEPVPARTQRGTSTAASAPALERAPAPAPVVHVTGAVRRPGVYELRAGSRVRDAVRRAGGVARGADTAAINLAAKLADGQQIVVPRRVAPAAAAGGGAAPLSGAGAAAAPAPSGPLSLGSATLEQLQTLDGVGPATAQKIIDWRTRNGGFSSVDELDDVPGIGPKKLEALRGQVTP